MNAFVCMFVLIIWVCVWHI